jgi:hypothetical protein
MEGEVFYHFDSVRVPESKVVEEFRAFVPEMKAGLRKISSEPTAASHTPDDVALDLTTLRQYLETRKAGPIVYKAIEQAYIAEYGRSLDEQSCLNFLLFIHADRRSSSRRSASLVTSVTTSSKATKQLRAAWRVVCKDKSSPARYWLQLKDCHPAASA